MAKLNKVSETLVKELGLAAKFHSKKAQEVVETTKTASSVAVVYEKARNAVEFRADHLIRQAAIERIITRRIFLNQKGRKLALALIKELLWARYLVEETVDTKKIEVIDGIIEKYRLAISRDRYDTKKILGLAACEIEETLVFNPTQQIIINYVSESISSKIDFDEDDKRVESIQVYIAVERSFAKNSEILIAYKLLKVFLPQWKGPIKPSDEIIENLFKTLTEIDMHLSYSAADIIRRKVIQMSPPFNVIRDLIEKPDSDFAKVADDESKVESESIKMLEDRYHQTKDKVLRASKRSIIYIFLTKMILGVLLEFPFDLFFGKINYLALSINIIFPPALMFLLNSYVQLPTEKNTSLIMDKIKEYLYTESNEEDVEILKTVKTSGKADRFFFSFFIISSVVILFGILWTLNLLGFNPISQIIFIFFLSVVSFFAFRVRDLTRDYMIKDTGSDSLGASLVDYLFLPVIKIGQWLSVQISKLNILSFIFDFIIEAPLKTFLEVLEHWLHFVRIKKEEILS